MRGGAGNYHKPVFAGVKQLPSSAEHQHRLNAALSTGTPALPGTKSASSLGLSTGSSALRGLSERTKQLIKSDKEDDLGGDIGTASKRV